MRASSKTHSMPALVKHISSFPTKRDNCEIKALQQCINRLENEISRLTSDSEHFRMLIPANAGYSYVALDDVVYFKAAGNYSHVYFSDGTRSMLSKTIKSIHQSIYTNSLIRCHQSYLINKKYIRHISDGACEIRSAHHHIRIPVSRRKMKHLLKELRML